MFSYKSSSIKLKLYVINTYSGFENHVKKSLLERIKKYSLGQYFGDIIIPLENNDNIHKKTSKLKVCFPGYIIVEIHLTQQTWLLIKQTPKIIGFVGKAKYPVSLKSKEIKHIKKLMMKFIRLDKNFPYKTGDYVKIKKGPFMNLGGVIEKINMEKREIKIMVSIFGRQTPIKIDILYVDRIQK